MARVSVDAHGRAGAGGAGIAVGVATGDDTNPDAALSDVASAIAYGFTAGEFPHGNDLRFQLHDRLEPGGARITRSERVRAVEQDARPRPIAAGLRPTEHSGGIAQAHLSCEPFGRRPKRGDLLERSAAVRLVGTREVRHQHDVGDVATGTQTLVGDCELARRESDPMHAAIELEPDGERSSKPGRDERFDLPAMMHGCPQPLAHDLPQLRSIEKALEQQYRRADSGSAQGERFLDRRDGEPVGFRRERSRARYRTVAVGVSLHHGKRFAAVSALGELVVVAQRGELNAGNRLPTHDLLRARSSAERGAANRPTWARKQRAYHSARSPALRDGSPAAAAR